jgi:hypothetical protein
LEKVARNIAIETIGCLENLQAIVSFLLRKTKQSAVSPMKRRVMTMSQIYARQ